MIVKLFDIDIVNEPLKRIAKRGKPSLKFSGGPNEMVAWCHTLTPDVELVRGYADNSFTPYLKRL